MAIVIQRIDPWQERESIIDFLWEQRLWPWKTREDFCTNWDWRYTGLAQGETLVWLARNDAGEIVGHIAVYERLFRVGSHELKVGVPGNLLVRRDYRDKLVGPRLVTTLRTTVRDGRFDVMLAFANEGAHRMFERLGFTVIGGMSTYVRVLRWRRKLRRWSRVAAPAGWVLDGAAALRRALRARPPRLNGLSVRAISREELNGLSCDHWPDDSAVVASRPAGEFIQRRFAACPITNHQVYGLFDDAAGTLEGFCVIQGTEYAKVWCCQVNRTRLSEADALDAVARALPDADEFVVSLLPDTPVADDAERVGFRRRRQTDKVEARTWWSAYWLPTHPLADRIEDLRAWRLWLGSSHH